MDQPCRCRDCKCRRITPHGSGICWGCRPGQWPDHYNAETRAREPVLIDVTHGGPPRAR